MKAQFLKRFRKSFISLFIILSGYIVWACAGGDLVDGEDSNYAPEAFADNTYSPFFYSAMFYYDINYDVEHNSRFNSSNVQEWREYMGNGVDVNELDLLLNTASKGYVDSTKAGLTTLTITGKRSNDKVKSFLSYLSHAKACESFAVKNIDPWYEEKENSLPKANTKLYEEMNKAFTAAKDDFIRQRYWFQLSRYNYYYNTPAAIALFENNKNKFPKNTIYYRTMACAAGALYKQKNFAKANYYYSLVFAGNDKLKTVAHWSFHPQEETDWKQTLALCTTNEEKITLWQMLGIFYNDEIRSLQEIEKLDPNSKSMDLLLTRFVNKNENEYSWLTDKKDSREKIKTHLPWLAQVVDKAAISNPFLWNTSVGYLYFLSDNFSKAETYYKKAGSQLPNTSLASGQLRLLSLLNTIGALKGIRAADENKLLPDLKWLYSLGDEIKIGKLRYFEARRWIEQVLAKKYKQQHDLVKAECFTSTPGFYTVDKNVELLKALQIKKDPTPFEQFCIAMSKKKLEDCWAFQAIRDAYADDIDGALDKMKKSGSNAEVILLGNPFNGKIKDCHDCDHQATQKIKYSKLAFLEKLKEMKDNIAKGTDIYNNAMLLGNAFYNISHYGNARYFYESAVLGQGHYSPFSIDSVFVPMLTTNLVANKYYKLALDNATDDEQKAKCNYMMAKCARNEWYNRNYYSNKENEYSYDDKIAGDWKIFDGLSQYSHTKYYQEVLKECGYFNAYLQKKRKLDR